MARLWGLWVALVCGGGIALFSGCGGGGGDSDAVGDETPGDEASDDTTSDVEWSEGGDDLGGTPDATLETSPDDTAENDAEVSEDSAVGEELSTADDGGEGAACDELGDCADSGLPCVEAACESGKCTTVPKPDDTACDDGDPCTAIDVCANADCVGTPLDCSDADPCTADSCNAVTGVCEHAALPGAPCDDGEACTQSDTCDNGACAGQPLTCDDDNPCTDDACVGASGQCVFSPLTGAACDDADACTTEDACNAGECLGTPMSCSDGIACTVDGCDSASGQCTFDALSADGQACDDSDACTIDSVCAAGACGAGTKICACKVGTDCPIGDQCQGFFYCDTSGAPETWACKPAPGTGKVCPDDENPCTAPTCNGITGACGLGGAPVGTPCDDGNACSLTDVCLDSNSCLGTFKNCDNLNACTADSCNALTGECSHFLAPECDTFRSYVDDVQPIVGVRCAPCHTDFGFGDVNFALVYADTQKDSAVCAGKKVGECTIVRIHSGEMPLGAGCTGDPVADAGNSNCLSADEQDTIQKWIDGGMPEN